MLKKGILLMIAGMVVLGLNAAAFSMSCGGDHESMLGSGANSSEQKHGDMSGMDK